MYNDYEFRCLKVFNELGVIFLHLTAFIIGFMTAKNEFFHSFNVMNNVFMDQCSSLFKQGLPLSNAYPLLLEQ